MIFYIVIPTYNEKENFSDLVRAILSLELTDTRILVVDDHSPDGTGKIAERLKVQGVPIEIIHRPNKLGLGSAYIQGFQYALDHGADFVIEMDADFSHDPKDIPRLLATLHGTADVVIGSRRVPGGRIIGWSFYRRAMSRLVNYLARVWLGLKPKDVSAGFRGFRRSALLKLLSHFIHSHGYSFQEESLFYLQQDGVCIEEIPVTFTDRKQGSSKLTWHEAREFISLLWKMK